MCGIAGIFDGSGRDNSLEVINNMIAAISHRGPDDKGNFIRDSIALGHTRLSIIDTSIGGHQPMTTSDGRYTIVFNGEIYNYKHLRNRFSAHYSFKTATDTEVILAGFEQWGISVLHELSGIFAFAVWDAKEDRLYICRDHLGVKQVYYSITPSGTFLFSSELRSLLASNRIKPVLCRDALVDFLRYQRVHAPQTILKSVHVLLPGHYLTVERGKIEEKKYFDLTDVNVEKNSSRSDSVKQVRTILETSIEEQMTADVEVGAFLSGGIDSTVVVGLMSQLTSRPFHTFSVTFQHPDYDESKYSQLIAKRFHTLHHQIELTPDNLLCSLPDALDSMDHPTADGINTYLISKKTRETGIKVALSGLGGDELFGGYPVFKAADYANRLNFFNNIIPHDFSGWILQLLYQQTGKPFFQKASDIFNNKEDFLTGLLGYFRQTYSDDVVKSILKSDKLPLSPPRELSQLLSSKNNIDVMSKVSIVELKHYLSDTLLRDVDQMSMAHALEVRVPFLDPKLVRYVLSLPDKHKKGKYPKQLLIDATRDILPPEIYSRKKMGFVFPWNSWMRTDLKDFCVERVNRFAARQYIAEDRVHELWKTFLSGHTSVNWSRIWQIVVLEDWLTRNNVND